jgi:Zn-dependent protease
MFNDSITLGRLFGIRIAVSLSWFVIFFLVIFALGTAYFPSQYPRWPQPLPWVVAVVASLLFFRCVLLHELAHSRVALSRRVPVRSITLFIFGGVSHLSRDAPTPGAEFMIALAGPLTSLGLGAVCGAGYVLARGHNQPVEATLLWLAGVNLSLGLFNLLPGFPLDGGRLLRAVAWFAAEDYRWATVVATRAGQLAALVLLAAGFYLAFVHRSGSIGSGAWLMFIGWFLLTAANSSYQVTMLYQALEGVVTRDVMRRDPLLIDGSATLNELGELLLSGSGRGPAVVLRDGRPIGLADEGGLRRSRIERHQAAGVERAMRNLDPRALIAETAPASQALAALLEGGHESLPVVSADRIVVGLVRRGDLLRLVALRRRAGG